MHTLRGRHQALIGLLLASWLMLFVSAPTHALSHYDDIGFTHCGLCIHHHQMQACLPLSVTPLALSPQVCPQQEQPSVCVWRQHVNHFQGRAPPQLK